MNGISHRGKYRIGKKVFHIDKELWLQCKENHVSDRDVMHEYMRFHNAGITNVTYETAVAAALREKKAKFNGGVNW